MAFPWLQVGGMLLGSLLGGDDDKPQAPERMDWSQAYNIARDTLTPGYEQQRDNTFSQIDNNNVARGFYGQAPADSMKMQAGNQMYNDFQSRVNQYARGVQNDQMNADMQTYQYQMQEHNQPNYMGSIFGGLMGNSNFTDPLNELISGWF
ncbi:MAG: hypothetical protein ACLFPF_10390 [Halanaerobiales bacterium]